MNPYIISSPPSDILVQEVGNYVELNCSSSGSPLPKVQWLKDGKVISEAGYNAMDLTMSKLIIPSFKPSDMGLYSCRFYNSKNSTVESSTNLGMYKLLAFNPLAYAGRGGGCQLPRGFFASLKREFSR